MTCSKQNLHEALFGYYHLKFEHLKGFLLMIHLNHTIFFYFKTYGSLKINNEKKLIAICEWIKRSDEDACCSTKAHTLFLINVSTEKN